MRAVIKFTGIVLVFCGFAFFGFFKSFSKREYIRRLKEIISSLDMADNMLRLGALSREKILKTSFSEIDKPMPPKINRCLNAFFSDFGSGDTQTERGRIRSLKKELLSEIDRQEAEYKSSGRLWRTAGVCTGLAICIMLI